MSRPLPARFIALAGICALLSPRVIWAHHSFAMFDFERDVTLIGTVKEFQWGNPHVFIDLAVPGEKGTSVWSVEMTSPSHLVRNGWKPTTLKPGDPLKITVHPLRDGRTGGTYVSAMRADGTPVVTRAIASARAQP